MAQRRVAAVVAGSAVLVCFVGTLAGLTTPGMSPATVWATPRAAQPSSAAPDTATSSTTGRLATLRVVADALGRQGRARFADTYGGLTIDLAHRRTLLYVTSMLRGRQLVRAASAQVPTLDRALVVLRPAAYSQQRADARLNAIMSATFIKRYAITSADFAPDASAIEVTTTSTAADPGTAAGRQWLHSAGTALSGSSGIRVEVRRGPAIRAAEG